MTIKSDRWIKKKCQSDLPMIWPFQVNQVRRVEETPTISFGVSSYGYDAVLAPEVEIFTNINNAHIDPKRPANSCRIKAQILTDEDTGEQYVWLPPNSFMLGRTLEYFRIPRNVLVICLGKSTYARAGAIVNVTPLEPEWEGNVVIEISNTTGLPMKVYVNEGICQFVFFESDEDCEVSYADRGGKYQGQTGITVGKV